MGTMANSVQIDKLLFEDRHFEFENPTTPKGHDIEPINFVILSDSEESSSICRAAIQGEEDVRSSA